MALTKPIHLCHVLEATEGGTRRWLEHVVLGLDNAMFRQTCICAMRRDETFAALADRFRENGCEVFMLDMVRAINPWKDAVALWKLKRHFAAHRYDIVHVHSSKAGILGRVAAYGASARPCVYTPHGYAFLAQTPLRYIYRTIERLVRPITDHVIAVSHAEEAQTIGLGYSPAKVSCVENGVDVPELDSHVWKSASQIVIGSVGNLRPQKDPETFLRACALVADRNSNIRFLWCGMGHLEGRAKRLAQDLGISDRTTFTGLVSDADAIMRSLSVFVLTSRYEGLSYALLEAMALELPIVATNIPGNRELISHMENGLLVPPEDPEQLAAAIDYLLNNPDMANSLGQKARARVMAGYQLSRQLEGLSAVYTRLARGQ